MVNDISIHSLRLSSLPKRTRELLSLSLNSEKIIPSDGPDKLPRGKRECSQIVAPEGERSTNKYEGSSSSSEDQDSFTSPSPIMRFIRSDHVETCSKDKSTDWRGLAFQISLSSQIESHIRQCVDKTARVLEMWQHINSNATVEYLLRYLENIDRYDVAEDVYNDLKIAISRGEIVANNQNRIAISNSSYLSSGPDTELLTDDDRPGYVQIYDAMVLYADEDAEFVEHMMQRMTDEGYQICTVDRLQAGHTTQYAPMARLLAERCRRVVLVLSPAFLDSPAMKYYTNFAAADGIETEQRKILPIMYRSCELPRHLSYYHKLFYESNKPPLYDFWKKLFQCLEVARMSMAEPQARSVPSIQTTPPPQITIDEYPSSKILSDYMDSHLFLPRTDLSISMPRLDAPALAPITRTENCHSLNNVSEGKKKKKKNYLLKFFSTLKGKKTKIMVEE